MYTNNNFLHAIYMYIVSRKKNCRGVVYIAIFLCRFHLKMRYTANLEHNIYIGAHTVFIIN